MNDQGDLEDLSALVTGATSGIGRAAAEELGRHGAEVVVHGRNRARGSAVAGTITAEGGTARFVAADLSDPAELEDLAGSGHGRHAGQQRRVLLVRADRGVVATFDRLFAANVRAAYFLVAALAPKMAARGSGSVISLGSMAGPIGPGRRRHQSHPGVNDLVLGGRSLGCRTPSWWTRHSPARRSRG